MVRAPSPMGREGRLDTRGRLPHHDRLSTRAEGRHQRHAERSRRLRGHARGRGQVPDLPAPGRHRRPEAHPGRLPAPVPHRGPGAADERARRRRSSAHRGDVGGGTERDAATAGRPGRWRPGGWRRRWPKRRGGVREEEANARRGRGRSLFNCLCQQGINLRRPDAPVAVFAVRDPREGGEEQAAHHQAGEGAQGRSPRQGGARRGALRERVGSRVSAGLSETGHLQDAVSKRARAGMHGDGDAQGSARRDRRAADPRVRQVQDLRPASQPALRGCAQTEREEGVG
mmetsp:Transcript_474/g.1831  ORF Transcript_474/g.1831 Transcript_474/m.1831 type:complete len:286 (+) Transcript_474:288-1145(+)